MVLWDENTRDVMGELEEDMWKSYPYLFIGKYNFWRQFFVMENVRSEKILLFGKIKLMS